MKTSTYARHGDLSFRPADKIEGVKVEHKGSFVLALGEHTGHKHVISVPKLEDMDVIKDAFGGIYLVLRDEATITHEEHASITLLPGKYKMNHEREFNYALGEIKKVVD